MKLFAAFAELEEHKLNFYSQVAAVWRVSTLKVAGVHGERLDEGGVLSVGIDVLKGGAVVKVVEASRAGLAVILVIPCLAQAAAVAALGLLLN